VATTIRSKRVISSFERVRPVLSLSHFSHTCVIYGGSLSIRHVRTA
jgi:hypothetical protein